VGYSRDELLAMTPLHIAPQFTEPEFRALLAPLIAGEMESTQFVTEHRRRDGVDVPVEVVLQVKDEPDLGGQSFVAMVRDVRERIEAEQRLRETERELHTLEDHERIARDLHDIVIQQLFASGMTLQGVWSRIREPEVAQRVATVVDDLDRTIREIRSVIFGLQAHETGHEHRRTEIQGVLADETAALGFEPRARFDGPIESIPDHVAPHLLATLREALSNVARHARASQVHVSIEVGDEIVLRVEDDGIGVGDHETGGGGNGVRNMRDRAAQCGGRFELRPAPDGGTVLEWHVPAA
jgi:PAS domain S-box-containing protein